MHAAPRRPAVSWPAALLPAALALALLSTGVGATMAGGSAQAQPPADRPVTELHVEPAGR
jgi:hypothetical protein